MRVVFVSDHFSTPDEPGILRTWQLCRHLCEQGDQVTVIAPGTHYLFSGTGRRSTPLPDGLHLVPLRSRSLDRRRVSSRLRYYLAQLIGATKEAWRAGPCDIVVAGQTPSVLSIGPYLVARARKVPFVLDERDLALDAATELRLLPAPVLVLARLVERFLHRRADGVVAVTPGLRRVLDQRGVRPARLWLVPNGLDAPASSEAADAHRLRSKLGWDDKVVLLYAGGLGQAYDLGVVLDAMAQLRASELLFAVLGDGEHKDVYREQATEQGLAVQFLDPRPKNEVAAFCQASDICVLPLQAVPRSSYVLSNKLFDYLGSGRPVVATGPGDTADLLLEADAGLVVPAGDAQAMASAITALARDPRRRADMGESGRSFVEENWRREDFARRFRDVLQETIRAAAPYSSDGAAQEAERMLAVYHGYDADEREQSKRALSNPGVRVMAEQRWGAIREVLQDLPHVDGPKVLDVGCGGGGDLSRVAQLWADRSPRLHGIDLLPDRIERARALVPDAELLVGSAHHLPFPDGHFDVVLVSTVFSSILDEDLRRAVAAEILRVLAPGATAVCYDVRLPNPTNRNTRPVTRRNLRALFSGADVSVRSLTVVPPIARRLGGATRSLHGPLHRLPFLRSHNLTTVHKQTAESPSRRILFVTHAQHRFTNMTVNQRIRALAAQGPVDVLTCYPSSFPSDVERVARIIGLPFSSRICSRIPKLCVFTAESLMWTLFRGRSRRYCLIYSFQDTSAVVGWALQSPGARWVIDAVDDPALELANAMQRGQYVKSLLLTARDKVLRALFPKADLVCTIGWDVSDPLPALLAESYGVEPGRILPLNQAIDIAAVGAVRHRAAPSDKPTAVFVGFVSPLRGVDTLLEAGRICRAGGLDLDIELIGHLQPADGPWLDDFMRRHPGLVHYRGVLQSEQTLEAMAGSTLGVLPFPARRELQPVQQVTGLEYLALGKPLVMTRLTGNLSLVEDGANGFVVEPGDADAMAEAMAKIVGDPAMARAMSESALARASAFDVGKVNARLAGALSAWA